MSEVLENKEENVNLNESIDEPEPDPQFKPLVSLPEVEVNLNEENEDEMLKIRAKLYRFDNHCEPPEWKERGTGELKLLKHTETSAVRVVMRRDKTYKICANHYLTPWMELKKNSSSERAFIYTVPADYADEKLKSELLAVKFGSIENANLFKTKFEEAQKVLKTDCDLYNGTVDQLLQEAAEDSEDENKENEENNENSELTTKLSELDVNKKDEEKLK